MIDIIVFGKPRSFESYEYVFGEGETLSSSVNTHREPMLRPSSYDSSILHYFVDENREGMEIYARANGFESDRDGIVFGVAIKSTTCLKFYYTVFDILIPYLSAFADALLNDGVRFKYSSIIDILKNTEWKREEIESIQNASDFQLSVPQPSKKILLLVVDDMQKISSVENIIKEYGDVYIAKDAAVFKDSMNQISYDEANRQIYTIADGVIVPLKDSSKTTDGQTQEPLSKNASTAKFVFVWGKGIQKVDSNDVTSNEEVDSTNDLTSDRVQNNDFDSNDITPPPSLLSPSRLQYRHFFSKIIICVITILLFSCGASWLYLKITETDNNIINGSDVTPTPPYRDSEERDSITVVLARWNKPIEEKFDLKPQIISSNTELSYIPSDINYRISNTELIEVIPDSNGRYLLNVIKRPDVDTKVTVTALIENQECGKQTYTIARRNVSSSHSRQPEYEQIPPYNGKPRTMNTFLKDLATALNNKKYDFVIKECKNIVDGKYGQPKNEEMNLARELLNKALKDKEKQNGQKKSAM